MCASLQLSRLVLQKNGLGSELIWGGAGANWLIDTLISDISSYIRCQIAKMISARSVGLSAWVNSIHPSARMASGWVRSRTT